MVFYETPHRIADAMDDLFEEFGPDRAMALCRELTKDYEEVRRGTIGVIRQTVQDDPPRGEMVVVVAGASGREAADATESVLDVEGMARLAMELSKRDDMRVKDAIARVVEEHPLPDGSLMSRKQVYSAILAMRG